MSIAVEGLSGVLWYDTTDDRRTTNKALQFGCGMECTSNNHCYQNHITNCCYVNVGFFIATKLYIESLSPDIYISNKLSEI